MRVRDYVKQHTKNFTVSEPDNLNPRLKPLPNSLKISFIYKERTNVISASYLASVVVK